MSQPGHFPRVRAPSPDGVFHNPEAWRQICELHKQLYQAMLDDQEADQVIAGQLGVKQ